MSLRHEAREYVAGLADGELAAMLGRQLSARLRHAAEAERATRDAVRGAVCVCGTEESCHPNDHDFVDAAHYYESGPT